ncbi:MAG: aminotransferase class I/II-fold pyridoxal phosphate-dependent enzyme [Chromatiales bacterium]
MKVYEDNSKPIFGINDTDEIRNWCKRLKKRQDEGVYSYFQCVHSLDGSHVSVNGDDKIMFATYNYLGLLGHPDIINASIEATRKYGTGTHGVRINGGTLDIHEQLEEALAVFADREDAVVFSSGYAANVGIISAFMNHGDYIISDKYNHASIVDGCMLSGATVKRFRHNDMEHLELMLRKLPPESKKLVIADAVFSMDGDIFKLPMARRICNDYGAFLMIDEAHSVGVLGENGKGIEEYFNMPNSIDIKMGTLSKSIPSVGGYVAATRNFVSFLKHQVRPFIFSAALSPASTAAAMKALELIGSEGKERCSRLMHLVEKFISGLKKAGFNTGLTENTPIVPIITGNEISALALAKYCQEYSLFALPVLAPAVHPNESRLRVNITADHSESEIDYALDVITRGGKKLRLIQ